MYRISRCYPHALRKVEWGGPSDCADYHPQIP